MNEVNRRIGGLENCPAGFISKRVVNRRIGGLENSLCSAVPGSFVNRRIGGLESQMLEKVETEIVNRRIGGLENLYFGQWGCIVIMTNNIDCVIIELYSLGSIDRYICFMFC